MPRAIIKIKDKYFEWSTVVDAPVTYGMTESELREYVKERHGSEGLRELPARLARVADQGTSFHADGKLDDLLELNRAGDNETCLTKDEIYAKYANPPNEQKLSHRRTDVWQTQRFPTNLGAGRRLAPALC